MRIERSVMHSINAILLHCYFIIICHLAHFYTKRLAVHPFSHGDPSGNQSQDTWHCKCQALLTVPDNPLVPAMNQICERSLKAR